VTGIVVSDASPIRSLAAVGTLHVLQSLYGRVIIPPAVSRELVAPASTLPPLSPELIESIDVIAPADRALVTRLGSIVDPGEAEAIALAIELSCDRLLIDERHGRELASSLGLTITGVVGILIKARDAGLVVAAGPLLMRMKHDYNFWVSDTLIAQAEKGDRHE